MGTIKFKGKRLNARTGEVETWIDEREYYSLSSLRNAIDEIYKEQGQYDFIQARHKLEEFKDNLIKSAKKRRD